MVISPRFVNLGLLVRRARRLEGGLEGNFGLFELPLVSVQDGPLDESGDARRIQQKGPLDLRL